MFKEATVAVMYAVTPCHAGSGSALGVVDLPIQRERHTNWPIIQSSGVKGAFRANFDFYKDRVEKEQFKQFTNFTESIFGSDSTSGGFAGSLSVSDARILAYPMRSNIAPFVWITCPAVLKQFARNLYAVEKLKEEDLASVNITVAENDVYVLAGDFANDAKILLEDCEVTVKTNKSINQLKEKFIAYLKDAERLLLVSDEVFNYGVSNCTQIMAQIKIDQETGTTSDGSLRYQEELPCDTIMYTILNWGDSHNKEEDKLKAETIKNFVTEEVIKSHIQIGGDITTGRGIFKIDWK